MAMPGARKRDQASPIQPLGNLVNASTTVEERRLQRRVKPLKSVRASAPVVGFSARAGHFPKPLANRTHNQASRSAEPNLLTFPLTPPNPVSANP